MSDQTTGPTEVRVAEDGMTEAIIDLERAITANAADERLLLGRLRKLRTAHRSGTPWRAILQSEPQPSALSLASRVSHRLALASQSLRRTLALRLMREGATTSEVAGYLAVSRQRVSHLVRKQKGRSS